MFHRKRPIRQPDARVELWNFDCQVLLFGVPLHTCPFHLGHGNLRIDQFLIIMMIIIIIIIFVIIIILDIIFLWPRARQCDRNSSDRALWLINWLAIYSYTYWYSYYPHHIIISLRPWTQHFGCAVWGSSDPSKQSYINQNRPTKETLTYETRLWIVPQVRSTSFIRVRTRITISMGWQR